LKLYHLADQQRRIRILVNGFDEFDAFVTTDGIVFWPEGVRINGYQTIEIDVPDDVAGTYAVWREKAKPGEPPAFYRLPANVANRYLRGA